MAILDKQEGKIIHYPEHFFSSNTAFSLVTSPYQADLLSTEFQVCMSWVSDFLYFHIYIPSEYQAFSKDVKFSMFLSQLIRNSSFSPIWLVTV